MSKFELKSSSWVRPVCLKGFFNNFHFSFLDTSTIAQVETVWEIRQTDVAAITTEVESIGSKSNSTYTKWSDKDRYLIGKYASENEVAAAVREFKIKFPNFNESTVRSFRKKVEAELRKASKEKSKIQSNRKIFVNNRTPFWGSDNSIQSSKPTWLHKVSEVV